MKKIRGVVIKMSKDVWAIAYCAVVVIVLMLGLWGGWAIAGGYYKPEIARLNAEVDKAKDDVIFWQNAMRGLAEGGQLEGVDIKYGRPNVED